MDALSQSGMDVFSTQDQDPEKTVADTTFNKSIGDLSTKFDQEVAPYRQKELQAASAPLPKPPKMQESGAPPSGEMGPQTAAMWVAAASVLGMIAGRGGRAGSMNALAAFSGALEGLTSGNKEKFERESKVWEENNKKMLQHNQNALQEYKLALENTELDARQRSMQIQLIANKYHDEFMGEVAKHAAATGDFSTMAIVYDSKFANDKKLGDTFSKLQMALETRRQQQADALERIKLQNQGRIEAQSMRLTGGMGMEGIEEEAQRIANLTQAPYTPAQTKNNPRAAAAMARAQELGFDQKKWLGAVGTEKSLDYGTLGQQVTSLNTAINHLDYLDQLGDALQNNDVQRINSLKNRAITEFGGPLPNSFEGVKQYVLDEVAKAVIGSKTAAGDRNAAQALISQASSPAQIHDAIKKIKTLMQGRLEPIRLQVEQSLQKGDFDKRLTPAAKQEIGGSVPLRSGGQAVDAAKWSQGDGSLQKAKNIVATAKSKNWTADRVRTYLRAKAQEMGIPSEKMEAFISKNVMWDTDGGT